MAIALEDSFSDVVGKAQRGLGLDDGELIARSGISLPELHRIRAGHFEAVALEKLAPVLGLDKRALLGLPDYRPEPVHVGGLWAFNTPWNDMMVNSYLVWDSATGDAVAFDTGADCTPMLDAAREKGVAIRLILLTHTHGDHVFDLDRLAERTGASAFGPSREPLEGAEPFDAGREFRCGQLRIESRPTWGHSPGGTTFLIHGLERPVAVVGDALFAGSMGGANTAYADALRNDRQQILSLSAETVLCPGHGPITTVGEELRHNPFFAGR